MSNKRSSNEASGSHASPESQSFKSAVPDSRGAKRRARQAERRRRERQKAGERGYMAGSVGRRRRSPVKIILVMLVVIVALVGAGYAGVATYFDGRFYPDTVIGDVDVSLLTEQEAAEQLAASVEDYTLSVSGQGFELELTAADAGLDIDAAAVVAAAEDGQDRWSWPWRIGGEHDYSGELLAAVDSEGMEQALRAAVAAFNETASAPVDATVAYDEDAGAFAVVADELGTSLDADAVVEVATQAFLALEDAVTLTEEQLTQPSVTADDEALATAVEEANALLATNLTLALDGTELVALGGEDVAAWVSLDEELSVTLDTDALTAWVEEEASEWGTVGGKRSYTRADGEEITVSGGDWGWEIDVESLVATVTEAVLSGSTETIEVPCTSEGEVYAGSGQRDWGERYLDVDLSEQHVYFYDEDGEVIWESDCVSGAPTEDRETPTGVYSVNMKESPSTLVGYDDDGEVSYESEVTYWMPFKGNSVGFHDASWQSAFGGTRYKDGYGSHGCVNLPTSAAEELYELIEVGDVVVVHW